MAAGYLQRAVTFRLRRIYVLGRSQPGIALRAGHGNPLGSRALLTAWAAFQASLFHGDQADRCAGASLSRARVNAAFDEGDRKFLDDQALFLAYIDASTAGRSAIATYLRESLMSERLTLALAL